MACMEWFSGDTSFDKHRVGSYGDAIYNARGEVTGYTKPARRCLSIAEMTGKGMKQNTRGDWTTGEEFTDAVRNRVGRLPKDEG